MALYIEPTSFVEEAEEIRRDLTKYVLENYPVTGNLQLRTKLDSLLIIFDQAVAAVGDVNHAPNVKL